MFPLPSLLLIPPCFSSNTDPYPLYLSLKNKQAPNDNQIKL